MKKRFLTVAITLVVIAMLVPAVGLTAGAVTAKTGTWGEYQVANGTYTYVDFSPFVSPDKGNSEATAYEISTPAQLAGFAALVNAYNGSSVELIDAEGCKAKATDFFVNSEKQHVKLIADIDLSEHRWMPIGMGSINTFKGSFDGGGHTISGLLIESSEIDSVGLFGYVTGGTVKNVGVSGKVNVKLTSSNAHVGGLVGYAQSVTIENCYSACNVSGSGVNAYVGGLVGNSSSNAKVTITNSYNTGNVSATSTAGGLVGNSSGKITITNCYNTGSVSGTGTINSYAGGIVGQASDSITITNCYNTGSVSATDNAGGLVGYVESASAENCYWLEGSASNPQGNGYLNGSPIKLSAAQMKAAAGVEGALIDRLNAWVAQSEDATYREWHLCTAEGASEYPCFTPQPYSYTDNGDGSTHTKSLECCGVVVDEEDHFGSNMVTCLGTVCEGCGAYYGAKNSANHVSTEIEYRPDETEPDDYHNQHHACCGALIEDTQQHHEDVDYTMERVNDSGKYVFTKTCLTCNGVVGKQYITVADRPYDGTPYVYATDESEGDFGLLEGTNCCDGGCINEGDHTLIFVLSDQHRFEIPFTITPAPLTVTANNVTVEQYGKFPEFTYTSDGFLTYKKWSKEELREIEITDGFITEPMVKVLDGDGNEVTDTRIPGTYRIVFSGGVNDNYVITYIEGILTVTEHTEHRGGTATCTAQAKCEHCGEGYGELDADNHTENAYGYCEKHHVKITGASITAGVDLTMKYYVRLIDTTLVGEGQKLAMIFTMNGKTVTVSANEALVDGEYVFEFDGIAPQQMADLIDAALVIVNESGAVVDTLAEKKSYSVKANAEALLALYPEDAGLRQLVVDMLTYGAMAQNYKDHNVENLANKDLSSEVAPSEALPVSSDKTITSHVSELGSVYFTGATVWFDHVNRIGVTLSAVENAKLVVNGVEAVLTGTTYYTDAIYATGFDTVYTFELYDGDTHVQTLTYSISSYVFAMMNKVDTETGNPTEMAELARALYRYGASAKAYRASQSTVVVTNAEELQAALNAGGNIQLGGNIDLGDGSVSMTGGVTAVLDLNGYEITSNSQFYTIEIYEEDVLTVIDSSDLQSGAIVNENDGGSGIWNYGTLTVESGTVRSQYWGVNNYGAVYLNGGTIRGENTGIRNEGGTYENNGGTVEGGVDDDSAYIPV